MRLTRNLFWVFFLLPILFLNSAFGNVTDDETPEVTARVARISFLRGNVQIRHSDSQDWERATNNLPIVEGDEIAADSNSRLEIQFDSRSFLRLAENAYLKVTTLRDEGIALSLPNGSLSLGVSEFNKDRGYFEIDAPNTTISVQKAGIYRIDSGDRNDKQVRVSVTDGGQAQIYSDNSGFILRNGRSARIYLDGNNAGEWETTDASRYADDFDRWAIERDTIIAKRLRDADYDKYYDRDIYGAEDLNDYGDWVFTKNYGYVWKPYRSATANYSNWSPYRYGQWRWIPPYGWTWVNDEPWGWATYHHGRWVYDNGWYWSPYGQYRARRSWWSPALVIFASVGNNICWYPLPYNRRFNDYNRRRNNTTIINNNNKTVIINPNPSGRRTFDRKPVEFEIPADGVVVADTATFGKGRKGFRTAPPEIAQDVLSKSPSDINNPPNLPNHRNFKDRDIVVENPRNVRIERQTGAADRKIGVSMDDNLRKERIYGNRPPIDRSPPNEANEQEIRKEKRDTGAVRREPRPIVKQDNIYNDPGKSPPREAPSEDSPRSNVRREKIITDPSKSPPREAPSEDVPVRPTGGKSDNQRNDRPERKPRENIEKRENPPPSYSPPIKRDSEDKPSEQPRRQPSPPRSEQPKPRFEPQPPRQENKPRSEPAPPKQESKPQPERKEQPSRSNERKEKPISH